MTESSPKHWLFLRGLARETGHWQPFITQCQNTLAWQCHSLDLPGFGTEHNGVSPLSIRQIRQNLQSRLTLPEGEAIGIVALSLGGMVALDWLAHDPQRVHRAILINSSSANCPLWWRIQPRALPLLVRGVFAPSIDSQERWALRMVSNQHSEDASVLNRHKQLRAQHPAQKSNVLRQLWAASRFRAPAKLAPHQRLHLLASHGDRMVSWRCSNALAERFNCSLDVHPNAGHDLPLDAPDWVIQQFAAQR
ncbi:alpha/beta fold hydrolase [Spongiibacter marinus]|uniref:alpha/beta fold hydrolase n=1 Tax=Spongiibacter marinus TaxID=354246 RepID=UPI0035BE1A40